jgi:hypothetical protein
VAVALLLGGCTAAPGTIVSAIAPVPYPPRPHWTRPGGAPTTMLPTRMGIFRQVGLRGDATWMQAEYRSGVAVIQVTATPRQDAATRAAAEALLRHAPNATGARQLTVATDAPFWAVMATDAAGRSPAACWEYGVYTVCAALLTPHDQDTLRLFLAHWR